MITIKPAAIGSVSTSTLRPEDLIEAFTSELEWQIRRNGDYFSHPENFALRDELNSIVVAAQDCWIDSDGLTILDPVKPEEIDELINETLPDALTAHFAPPYCYFGSHPGDGADFGFWPSREEIDELPTVEDSDAAKALGEDCKSVNDHGNVTVYGGDGSILLELV